MKKGHQIETRMEGVPLSEGIAVARVCLFNENRHRRLPSYPVSGARVAIELDRVRRASALAAENLSRLRDEVAERIGPAESEIFNAQKMILEDPTLLNEIDELVRSKGINAEAAVTQALAGLEAQFRELEDEHMRQRASDFVEIRDRLLDAFGDMRPSLQCSEEHCLKGRNRIIVAGELTPSLTVELDAEHLMGFATERGGVQSHAAILARALGIPAVSGLVGIRDRLSCGAEILVDGGRGQVVLWPSEMTIASVQQERTHHVRFPLPAPPVAGLKAMANIGQTSDVKEAVAMQAEGVGLYRTEIELIAAGRLLTEDELYDRYLMVLRAMDGQPVHYRLPDGGSDKPLPTLDVPREDNPALGFRGTRLLLGRADLLGPQARALARVSQHGPVHVLYPMIADLEQFRRIRNAFMDSMGDIPCGEISHGVMFEVPAACLQASEILADADFASIGTNDLFQYLFAVDRNNTLVTDDYDLTKPAFWKMLKHVVDAARESGKPLSICGEIGSDPAFVPKLIDLGIRTFSMSARRIPAVRNLAARVLGTEKSVAAD